MPIGAETLSSLFAELYPKYAQAGEEEKARYAGGLGALERAAGLYGPQFMAGEEKAALAGMEQSMVGRGLGGTTRPGAVSTGMRAGFRDIRRQGLAGALSNIAQYMGGYRSQFAPTTEALTHLATGGFSGMMQQGQLGLRAAELEKRYPTPGTAASDYDVFGRLKSGRGGTAGGGTVGDRTLDVSGLRTVQYGGGGRGLSPTAAGIIGGTAPTGGQTYDIDFGAGNGFKRMQQGGAAPGPTQPQAPVFDPMDITSGYGPLPEAARTAGWSKPGSTQKAYWGGKRDYGEWAAEMKKLGWSQTA